MANHPRHTLRLLAGAILVSFASQLPNAMAAVEGPAPFATAAVARQQRAGAVTAPHDDTGRLALMVRNEISRRHEARSRTVFATVGGLDLHLPGAEVIAYGFHEARAQHLALQPTDASALVMPSRGREGAATSAVDVVLPAGEDVLAPISGRVVKVVDYLLYDEHPDIQIEIVPDGRPDLVMTIFHVSGVTVREGQHVDAGDVIADSARVFQFVAQVEQWGSGPHVDIRVRGD